MPLFSATQASNHYTLLGGSSFARFCQQEFGEFPRPAWAVGNYSSGPPAGGTPQILVDKTLRRALNVQNRPGLKVNPRPLGTVHPLPLPKYSA